MELTYEELAEKETIIRAMIQHHGDDIKGTKLEKHVTNVVKEISKLSKRKAELVTDINLEHAAVDNTGVLLTAENGAYRFTKEQEKKRIEEIRKLNRVKVVLEESICREGIVLSKIHPDFIDELKQILF